jgi:hypothetical protein
MGQQARPWPARLLATPGLHPKAFHPAAALEKSAQIPRKLALSFLAL